MLRSGVLALISMLVLLQEVSAQDTAEKAEAGKRDPKLFYVTTQSTTSTITTASFCYTTNAALTAACRRKKRVKSFQVTSRPGAITRPGRTGTPSSWCTG